jgi:hypothetical protein
MNATLTLTSMAAMLGAHLLLMWELRAKPGQQRKG